MSVQYVYQPPLTHKTRGPGLILVLYAQYSNTKPQDGLRQLDPPPVQKWAEEGFCVLEIIVPGGREDRSDKREWTKIIAQGFDQLLGKAELEVYESNLASEILSELVLPVEAFSIVVYLDQPHIDRAVTSISCPQLRHVSIFRSSADRALVQDASEQADKPGGKTRSIATYEYSRSTPGLELRSSSTASSFIHPASPNYSHTYAALAHTRTLTFLRTHIGGPVFDIETIWEAHTRFEFEKRDVDATMATMVAEPYVNHIPTLTGGIGRTALTSFYTHHFIHANPASTRMELVSRTIGPDKVVDEFVCEDQASVLVQIGLLPLQLAFPGTTKEIALPIVGVDQADKTLNPGARESNLLIERAKRGE
ncbi:hypothetical protein FRC07_014844 [Ceratobasidium sp. 392]|nr:hypothetical protein FRC07_014844 [Ceratobasidium sp. 392]